MSISDSGDRATSTGHTTGGTGRAGAHGGARLAGTRPVLAPHYQELRNHGATELARIVAAQQGWRLTGRNCLTDEHGEHIASTMEQAANAMQDLGWFCDDQDEVFIDWQMTPEGSIAKAGMVRAWLARHDPAVRSRTAF